MFHGRRLWPVLALVAALGCRTSAIPREDAGGPRPDAGPVDAGGADAARDAGAAALPRHERYLRALVPRLVIEIDAVAGAEPRASAEADLVARLERLLDKPGGIEIVHDGAIPSRGADHGWTFEELVALADAHAAPESDADTARMHVMWLDGHDAGDDDGGVTLGLAWANRHIVMYHDTIEANCGGGPLIGDGVCAEAQYVVWLHEVGHTIGLVDNGLEMVSPHRDPDHGRHDISTDCVMYYAMEGRGAFTLIRDSLLGGELPDFDDACLADIAAVQ